MSVNQENRRIFVYSHASGQSKPVYMGALDASRVRGKEIFSFEYDPDFLASDWTFDIDPNLNLYRGVQYVPDEQKIFGIFLDSAPDRWGRVLMERREAANARLEERKARRLMESDYLLGVFDESRMGALRFKTDREGEFLDSDSTNAAPPLTSLRELEHASRDLEESDDLESEDYLRRLSLLVVPGSSLGGARPKASVRDTTGALWIAKFPSKKDEVDQGAWEYLVYNLARYCLIEMAESKISTYYSNQNTFLTKRFDRNNNRERIHYFSAMTMLGYQVGADAGTGVSYLELAELILSRGAEVDKDLEQLWRRIVFNISVSNTDDHLRNHGFMLTNKGLRLSPAFDMNPDPKGYGLSLNIDEQNNALDVDLALSVAPFFRLSHAQAKEITHSIRKEVNRWESIADEIKISRGERNYMRSAFLSG